MQPAADRMAEALAENAPQGTGGALAVPLFANVTAAKVTDPAEERDLLVQQVTGRVRWRESVMAMHEDGATSFVELGGKVLTPMIKKIAGEAETASLITMEDIEGFAKGIGG
jgi:[acyl-carrier-protein] S-malonyltransferase